MIDLLTDNHYDTIINLFDNVKRKITIISPFLNMKMAQKLCECVKENNIECNFITRLYLEDLICKANNIDAIEMMVESGINVYAQKYLHTKLYLFDDNTSIIGSANFTSGGFISNIELSLLVSGEPELISRISDYCAEQVNLLKHTPDGKIEKNIIEEVKKKYFNLVNKKVHGVLCNLQMYGAEVGKAKINTQNMEQMKIEALSGTTMMKTDIMADVFRENLTEKIYNYNIWLKFDGSGADRIDPKSQFPLIDVLYNGKPVYIQNYPFDVTSIKNGDELFLAAVSSIDTDPYHKNQPVIVGRAKAVVFSGDKNVPKSWINKYPWMERYCYYCIIDNIEIIDTQVSNGIPLSALWAELGSDMYCSSFGKNESINEVAKKHHQKAHIRLTGNAKDYLDNKLDELGKKYGIKHYSSQL